jgi:hypothetical protein
MTAPDTGRGLVIPDAARLRPGDLIRYDGPGSWSLIDKPEAGRGLGERRLIGLLPALADFHDPTNTEARDVCLVCGDCECGGACPGAMEVVRQIIEALGCGDDDWDWWVDYFADDGQRVSVVPLVEAEVAAAKADALREAADRFRKKAGPPVAPGCPAASERAFWLRAADVLAADRLAADTDGGGDRG